MKRFLFLTMLIFIMVMIWVSVYEKEDDMTGKYGERELKK